VLVIARGREESDNPGEMPYPLTKSDLEQFECLGLSSQLFEDYYDAETPPVRRFRVLYALLDTTLQRPYTPTAES
jgi:hypothetical protein